MSIIVSEIPEGDNSKQCDYCDQTAKKIYTVKRVQLVYSCGNMHCDLKHLYLYHSDLVALISVAEDFLKVPPAQVLIALVSHPNPFFDGQTKAGFLIPGEDVGTYLWTEIFSGEELDMLETRLRLYNETMRTNRSIIVSEDKIPFDKIKEEQLRKLRCVVYS